MADYSLEARIHVGMHAGVRDTTEVPSLRVPHPTTVDSLLASHRSEIGCRATHVVLDK